MIDFFFFFALFFIILLIVARQAFIDAWYLSILRFNGDYAGLVPTQ